MKLLTCSGYYGTGSSAITDLLGECDNVHYMGDYEFRFVHDPDGICDLEYNLVLNNNRHNSGYAIKKYEKNVKFLTGNQFIKKYNRFFGEEWEKLSKAYIDKLIDVEYKGYWHQEVRDRGKIVYFFERLFNKFMHKISAKNSEKNYTIFLKNNTNYASYPGEKFYEYTRDYIDALFESVNVDHKEFVMADQLIPPSNVLHYLKFFNDLKVIVVDRDPRDLFLLENEKYYGTIVPRDVNDFCIWYKCTREHRKHENENSTRVLRINFEDLIFNYDISVSKCLEFCEIDKIHHVNQKKRFNPSKSIQNTCLYYNYPKRREEIHVIQKELQEYLYDFGKYRL